MMMNASGERSHEDSLDESLLADEWRSRSSSRKCRIFNVLRKAQSDSNMGQHALYPPARQTLYPSERPNPALRPLLEQPEARVEKRFSPRPRTVPVCIEPSNLTMDDYIEQYAKGAFDMSNPQLPPEDTSKPFVVPNPPNERTRVEDVTKFDILEPGRLAASRSVEHVERFRRLIALVRRFFATKLCLLCMLDGHREVVRCMSSWEPLNFFCYQVDRNTSFSGQPMVVYDATNDWRFKANPLVQGYIGVKFCAVCPLITSAGSAIGTLAILDTEKRSSFNNRNRKRLTELADLITYEIEMAWHVLKGYKHLSNFRIHENGIQIHRDRMDKSTGTEMAKNSKDMKITVVQPTSSRGSKTFLHTNGRTYIDGDILPIRTSRKSSDDRSFVQSKEILTHGDDMTKQQDYIKVPKVAKDACEKLCSPIQSGKSSRPDCIRGLDPSAQSSSNLPLVQPNETPRSCKDDTESVRRLINTSEVSEISAASNACQLIARTLSLDFVYLLHLQNVNKSVDDLSLLTIEILGEYGTPQPRPDFDKALHSKALLSPKGFVYRNPRLSMADYINAGFHIGVLIPLWTKLNVFGDRPETYGGVLLAGFARATSSRHGFSANEIRYLIEWRCLRSVLE